MKYDHFLPWILTQITRRPRYKAEYKWYEKSWSGNLFVFYHKLFWQRFERNGVGDTIAPETLKIQFQEEDGRWVTMYKFYTWHIFAVFLENKIREFLRAPKIVFGWELVPVPNLAFANGYNAPLRLPVFSFAVVVDTSSQDGNFVLTQAPGTNITSSFTMSSAGTGILFVGEQFSTTTGSDPVVSQSFNSVGMTLFQYLDDNPNSGSLEVRYLLGPSSGTHNIAINTGTVPQRYLAAASYTGVLQSGFPDATGTGSPQSITVAAGSIAASTTSVADNCWAFLWCCSGSGASASAGTNTTIRQNILSQGFVWADPNAAKTPAGTITLNITYGSNTKMNAMYGSFAPAPPDQMVYVMGMPNAMRNFFGKGKVTTLK